MRKTIHTGEEITARKATLAEIQSLWIEYGHIWEWQNPFITPPWLRSWWRTCGADNDLLLLVISVDNAPLGVAPLMSKNGTARFIGSMDLCDTGDFVVAPGSQALFFTVLLDYLASQGIDRLVLEPVRPDSRVCRDFLAIARKNDWKVAIESHGASLEMELPANWEEYLQSLDSKQRHEARRKLRRLDEAGVLKWRGVKNLNETGPAMEMFLQLFRQSRNDKKAFMTKQRETFFRTLADELAREQMLNLLCLTIDNDPAAAVFCVENGTTVYLYNNGFNPRFSGISLGVASKLMTIRSSIESGKRVYDFLNGRERYKYHLGGREVPLSRCIVENTSP